MFVVLRPHVVNAVVGAYGTLLHPQTDNDLYLSLLLSSQNAVTQSVANTAKRVIVIIGVALVLGESLDFMKLLGCGIGIGGVLLYSIIDQLLAKKKEA